MGNLEVGDSTTGVASGFSRLGGCSAPPSPELGVFSSSSPSAC